MKTIKANLKKLRRSFRDMSSPDADMNDFRIDIALELIKGAMKEAYKVEGKLKRLRELEKQFPDGFNNWKETYYEVVTFIHTNIDKPGTVIHETKEHHGTTGLYGLADEWTNEYETIHAGKDWDDDENETFWDSIESFLTEKNKGL